ncbi:MAG: isoprenyl transferase [Akkermansiaceae bacterium]|jgi:undecaprenyl diphosphate synthase|tara:strand:- start:4204 stop:4920 length:717 start_codon:yes stop_codon:yes gene_type:complete
MGDVPQSSTPQHVAVIMDGNGRWAESRGLPRKAGHRAGAESVREAADACLDLGIKFLTLYAFSSENWNRPEKEIDALMKLLEQFLKSKGKEFAKKNVRLRTIGRTQMLPDSCRAQLDKVKADTANNTALTVILALSYGSREELTDATQRIAQKVASGQLAPEDISQETVASHLDTADFPDPDLLIRTSGELRLSNFLLWQLSYAEFFISQKNWPDFRKSDFHEAVKNYSGRHRRFGRV